MNRDKRPIDNKNEIICLNEMFIVNVVLTGILKKLKKNDDIGYYTISIRNHVFEIDNNNNKKWGLRGFLKIINQSLLPKPHISFTKIKN